MNKSILPKVYCSIFLVSYLFHSAIANDEAVIPDISGEWVNVAENGEATEAIFTFSQDDIHLDGTFKDSNNGEIIIEAPSTGYIDINGNVIIDIYFGKITSTNRLKLSHDKNILEGTYTNNVGNQGVVHLRRK
jgi:hypothetical protein